MIDNKQIEKLNKILQKQVVQKFSVLAVALVVVGSVAYFGTNMQRGSSAAALPATLTLSPAAANVTTGSNVSLTLYADSSTDTVNAVQAALRYDPAQLQYVSMTEGTAFPVVAATSTATAGVIRVARATTAPSTVTGNNAIVTVTFKALASTGTATVNFDPAFSYIVRSTDNVNILSTTASSALTLRLPAPTISTISPASGPIAGGTRVTLTGTNFVSGATVTIGGVPATAVTYVSATTLTATAPAHAAGSVGVVVTNPDGQTVTRTSLYNYAAPAPSTSALSPASGTSTGGTTVTITGTNFVSGASVRFGSVAATSVVFVSPTSLTAVSPAGTAGSAAVVVTNPDGQASVAQPIFTYLIPAPTISAVSPASGPVTGGTVLTITGTNFAGITNVSIGGTTATGVVVSSSTTLTATAPAHAAGLVNVTVTNSTATATRTGAFTYRAAAPVVTSVSPNSGTSNGGTVITITGSNFASGATVNLGGSLATAVTVVSPTTIRATTTIHSAGQVDVVVTNPDTQSHTLAGGFFYLMLGDANNDKRVNAIDLSVLISHDGENYAPADFNGDGTVGAADMAILLGRWTW